MADNQWNLFGFMNAVREWMRRDPPAGVLLMRVVEFGTVLEREPTKSAQQEHANLWYHEVPGSEHGPWIVAITFTEEPSADPRFTGEVHCQTVSCVPYPQVASPAWPPEPHHRP